MKRNSIILKSVIVFILVGFLAPTQLLAEEFTLPEIESGKVILTWSELKILLEELEELKQAVTEDKTTEKEEEEAPPVEYSIVEAQLHGIVEGETARFEADISVHVLKPGWVTIHVFPDNVGIESVSIDHIDDSQDRPSTGLESRMQGEQEGEQHNAQLFRNKDGYAFIAKGPGLFSVRVTLHVPLQIENFTHTLLLTPPPSVSNRITLQIPEKEVNILQTEPYGHITQTDRGTTFQTVLNKSDLLKLVWKIEKDTGVYRKSIAVMHSLASIGKSAISVSNTIILKHLAALDQIELHVPLDVEILNITSADIERWSTEQSEHSQVIKLTGQIDRRAPVELELVYRLRLPPLPAQVAIPIITINGADTLEGFLGVEILGNLEVTPEETYNKFLMPAKNLPKVLWQKASSPLLHGYEFHDNTFSASLNIKSYQEVQTVVANVDMVDCVTHRTLEGKSVTRARYFIRNNDRQFLTLTLPENSRILQAFLDGIPIKPAQKKAGEILFPMKKSTAEGEGLQSFLIEFSYITEVSKLTLKGEFLNELPGLDLPVSLLKWTLYLPEDYEYTNFEGPLKQVTEFSSSKIDVDSTKVQIDIPIQGKQFLFEKYLVVDETPYVRGKYGQYLGDDIFLSVQPGSMQTLQKVTPMSRY